MLKEGWRRLSIYIENEYYFNLNTSIRLHRDNLKMFPEFSFYYFLGIMVKESWEARRAESCLQ